MKDNKDKNQACNLWYKLFVLFPSQPQKATWEFVMQARIILFIVAVHILVTGITIIES